MELLSMTERWLSVNEIASYLGVSKESIYRWTEKGKIPAHKLGRQWKFKALEVDKWMKAGAATASRSNDSNNIQKAVKNEI